MAVQANIPPAVRAIADLTQTEIDRLNLVLRGSERNIRGNQQIPRESLQAVLTANAQSINKLALDRGFYSEHAAQNIEIDVQVNPRIITQKPETLQTVIKKSLIQAVFGALGWSIAASNPVMGFSVSAIASVASSDAYKQQVNGIYNKTEA